MSHHRCACKSSYSSLGTSRETRGCILFTVLREYSIRQGRFPLFGHVSRSRPSTISQCAHRSTSSPYICRHGEVRGAGGWVCFSSQSSFFKPFSRTGTGKPVKSCTWIRRIPSDSSVGPVRRTRGALAAPPCPPTPPQRAPRLLRHCVGCPCNRPALKFPRVLRQHAGPRCNQRRRSADAGLTRSVGAY